MTEHDWLGLGYSSEESYIESKAGACPPGEFECPKCGVRHEAPIFAARCCLDAYAKDWPMPPDAPTTPPDDEDLEAPDA